MACATPGGMRAVKRSAPRAIRGSELVETGRVSITPPVELAARLWTTLGGDPAALPELAITGQSRVLPAAFDVTGFATAAVAVATAAGTLWAARTDRRVPVVTVDSRAACAAFVSEALFAPIGWQRPPVWDPLAGDYETTDGWIRLHTNYAAHRAAVERVLGPVADRDSAAAAVRRWDGATLEEAVVNAGGCAAISYDRDGWRATAAGAAASREPVLRRTRCGEAPQFPTCTGVTAQPFAGIRVLDLTRVVAGPVATRFLAAYGADVLRIDPPGFQEVPLLVPEMSVGKRCAALDLRAAADRVAFEQLVTQAHVVVVGLRPGAPEALGYGSDALRALNPALITASLDAYGWDGPWSGRRGFDSLVQMSTGIAAAGAAASGAHRPTPLPAQSLDHGTGYLLAAGVGLALSRQRATGEASDLRCSLVGTANVLAELVDPAGAGRGLPEWTLDDTAPTTTAWGPARRVPIAGQLAGVGARWRIDAGPLGRDLPRWA